MYLDSCYYVINWILEKNTITLLKRGILSSLNLSQSSPIQQGSVSVQLKWFCRRPPYEIWVQWFIILFSRLSNKVGFQVGFHSEIQIDNPAKINLQFGDVKLNTWNNSQTIVWNNEPRYILTKTSKVNIFEVKSVLESIFEQFCKSAIQENFNLERDPQMKKTYFNQRWNFIHQHNEVRE